MTLIVPIAVLLAVGCKDDDGNPTPANQAPGSVEITTEVQENNVLISWTRAVDPEGDEVKYVILVEDDTVAVDLEDTVFVISNLRYEKDYFGQVIAKDGKGALTVAEFTITTGLVFLKSYETQRSEYSLGYNEAGSLISIEDSRGDNSLLRNSAGKLVALGNLTYLYSTAGLYTGINDGKGEGIIEYDSRDRIVRLTSEYNTSLFSSVRIIRNLIYNDRDQVIEVNENTYNFNSGTTTYHIVKVQYDADGNLVQTKWESSYDNVTYTLQLTQTFTYDDKKNPWHNIVTQQTNFNHCYIANHLLQGSVQLSISNIYPTYLTRKNNITSTRIEAGSDFSQEDFTYSYNEDDYPISADIYTTSSVFPANTSYKRWYY